MQSETKAPEDVGPSPSIMHRRPRAFVPLVLGGVVVVVLAAGGALLARAAANTNKTALSAAPKGVTAIAVRAAMYRPSRRYVGTLEPWLEARVGPQLVSAYVDTVLVRPGSVVRRGDVVATLDCRNTSTANQAIGLQARAVEARQKALASESARIQELLDGGFVSTNEVEQKQAQTAAEDAHLAAFRAQMAGKALEVGDCVLRAPFDGEVATRTADPGTFARPGSSIVGVVDRRLVRLTADVSESDFDAVAPKTPVRITVLATGKVLSGIIARRSPSADASTRTIHFEVDLQNDDHALPVGTTAEIGLDVGEPTEASEIPLSAAKIRGAKATVFVIEGDVARSATVSVLGESAASLFVRRELAPGALVVTEGRSLLVNGDKVTAKVDPPAQSTATAPSKPGGSP
jgi:membrane fusion protein (multidrug efflux system)